MATSHYSLGDDDSITNCSTTSFVLTTTGDPLRADYGPVLQLTPSPEALKAQIKWVLLLHTYGFACLFFCLASYVFCSILNLRSFISRRPFMSTINLFLCLLGVSRAGCLFIDPYNLHEVMPKVLGSLLWDVGVPCITSAFCLIPLAFLQLIQLNLGLQKLRSKSCLLVIITAHFTFIIGADIATGFQDQLMLVKYVVQLVFLCWGIFLFCTFLYGRYRVMGLLRNMPSGLLQEELPDHQQNAGILQLALLAPYSNLASSVAAALVPTLLKPRIRITDENDQTFSFGSDSNSLPVDTNHRQDRLAASLTSDIDGPSNNSDPLTRASVRPSSRDPQRKISPSVQALPPIPTRSIVMSPANRRRSLESRKGIEVGSLAGSRRGSEVSRRGSEMSRRGSEVSRRGSEVKYDPGLAHNVENTGLFLDSVIFHQDGGEFSSRRGSECSQTGESSSCNLSHQLGTGLMRRGSSCSWTVSEYSTLGDIAKDEVHVVQQELSTPPTSLPVSGTGSVSHKKSLSWQQPTSSHSKEQHNFKQQTVNYSERSEVAVMAETTLLPCQSEQPDGVGAGESTLHSVLNHLEYVNKAALPNESASTRRKKKVQKVLNATYITALLGLMLCVADIGMLCGLYGLMTLVRYPTGMSPREDSSHPLQQEDIKGLSPWPWFCFQTLCRALEFVMGCAMADISKQPVHSRHQYLRQKCAYSCRY